MKVKLVEKGKNRWVILLESEDHTLANLIRELTWKNGGEAAYRIEHPLLARPRVKIVSENPKETLLKVARDIVSMADTFAKAVQ